MTTPACDHTLVNRAVVNDTFVNDTFVNDTFVNDTVVDNGGLDGAVAIVTGAGSAVRSFVHTVRRQLAATGSGVGAQDI